MKGDDDVEEGGYKNGVAEGEDVTTKNLELDTSTLAPRINNQLTIATGEDATDDGEASEGGKGRGGGEEGKRWSATMFRPINHVDRLPPSKLKEAIN
jgi:hypothetical protein